MCHGGFRSGLRVGGVGGVTDTMVIKEYEWAFPPEASDSRLQDTWHISEITLT